MVGLLLILTFLIGFGLRGGGGGASGPRHVLLTSAARLSGAQPQDAMHARASNQEVPLQEKTSRVPTAVPCGLMFSGRLTFGGDHASSPQ